MKKQLMASAILLAACAVYAASAPVNFSGKWIFDPAQSKNVGIMAQGKIHTTVKQSKLALVVDDDSVFNGQSDTQHTVYDLTGKPVTNPSMMAGRAAAKSHWEGTRLITDWESAGAITGRKDDGCGIGPKGHRPHDHCLHERRVSDGDHDPVCGGSRRFLRAL